MHTNLDMYVGAALKGLIHTTYTQIHEYTYTNACTHRPSVRDLKRPIHTIHTHTCIYVYVYITYTYTHWPRVRDTYTPHTHTNMYMHIHIHILTGHA